MDTEKQKRDKNIKQIWGTALFFLVCATSFGLVFVVESGGFYLLAFILSTNMMCLSFILYAMALCHVNILDELKKSQKPD